MTKLRIGLAGLAALGLSALATGGANAQGFSFTADFGQGYAAYDDGYGRAPGYRTVREDTYIRRDRGYGHDGGYGRHDDYGYGHRPRHGYGHGYGRGYGYGHGGFYGRPVGFAPVRDFDRECVVRVKKYFDGYSWVKEKRRTCR